MNSGKMKLWFFKCLTFTKPRSVTCNPFWTHASSADRTKREFLIVCNRFCWTKKGSKFNDLIKKALRKFYEGR